MKRVNYIKPDIGIREMDIAGGLCEDSPVTVSLEDLDESEPIDPNWDNLS